MLPRRNSKLLAQWKGPYEVTGKVSFVHFKVSLSENKETVYHVNMLKEWFKRKVDEKSKSEIIAYLNFISNLANNIVYKEDDVVFD